MDATDEALPNRLGNLRLRHFQLIDLLVSLGTVRKAAQAMNLTQPAASLMLRDLESVFGVMLFERSRRGMVATAAGLAMVDRARAITGESRLAAAQTGRSPGGAAPLLCVGALPRVMLDLMPLVVHRVHRDWPQLRLRFIEGVASQLLALLRNGEVDCVVARLTQDVVASIDPEEFHQQRLYSEGMCLVSGAKNPLASRRRLKLDDLCDAEWVLPPPEAVARQVFTNTFLRAGLVPPTSHIESLSVVSSMSLVQQAPYLTIAPSVVAHDWQRLGLLRVLPVNVDDSLSPIAFLCRHSNHQSGTVRRLGAIIAECSAKIRQPLSDKRRGNSAAR